MDVLLPIAARFVVGATLLFAAWAKLRDFTGFAGGLHDYNLLPPAAEKLAARLIPVAEVVIGAALLLGIAGSWPSIAATVLLAIFGAAIAITAQRGRDIPCHCFGGSPHHRVGTGAILRVVVLVLLALVVWRGAAIEPSPAWLQSSDDAIHVVSIAATMVLAVVLTEPVVLLGADLNRFASDRRDMPVMVVALDGAGVDYARELSERIVVVGDTSKEIQAAFKVSRTPLVFLLDEERRVANRTVSNNLIDLEDTLDGLGRPQGNAAWVSVAEANGLSPDGDSRTRAEIDPR